ncbi:MAG: hypothetical protein K6E88_11255 [Lachnospiraceae bacterium]|nr:hypothetical protein [Lachnospiraceae bacterium]
MACFTVPLVESVVVTAVEKAEEKRESNTAEQGKISTGKAMIPLSRKFKWLNGMLLGGSALLAFEHVWHGEVTPWFPFLTAMSDKADAMEMLHEISTVGVSMAALVTAAWLGICVAAEAILKRSADVTEKTTV